MVKFLGLFSLMLIFTGISLVSLSAIDQKSRMVIARSFFNAYPFHLSLLD
jgi:hypothetical protein